MEIELSPADTEAEELERSALQQADGSRVERGKDDIESDSLFFFLICRYFTWTKMTSLYLLD